MLDDYCNEQKITTVDFAKIDIEGYELSALKGWRKKLSNHSIRTIHIEIIPENQSRYGFPTNAPLLYLEYDVRAGARLHLFCISAWRLYEFLSATYPCTYVISSFWL